MRHLSLVDGIFLRQHHGHGTLTVLQGLWMFDEVVDKATLTALHRGLAVGPLNRRVATPRVPGARPYYLPYATIAPPRLEQAPVARSAVVRWADERAGITLNPEHGIGWELSAAPTDGGGMVVSLVCSHVLADARGLIEAVAFALDPDPRALPRLRAPRHRLWAEARDAAAQWWGFLLGSLRAFYFVFLVGENRDELVRFLRHKRMEKLRRTRAEVVGRSRRVPAGWQVPTTIVDIPAEQWDSVAARSGGTAHSLLLTVTANLLYTAGSRLAHESAQLGFIVRLPEGSGGPAVVGGSNPVTLALVTLNPRGTRYGELFQVRKRMREAVQEAVAGRTPGVGNPADLPYEALWVFPERVAHKILPDSGEYDGFASFVGDVGEGLTALGRYRVVSAAARAVQPRLTTAQALASRPTVHAWLIKSGSHYTLSVAAGDPAHFPDSRALRVTTIRELEKWGMSPQSWDSAEPGLPIPGGPSALV